MAERYQQFPSRRLEDGPEPQQVPAARRRTSSGIELPGRGAAPLRTLLARLVGRALGADGEPVEERETGEDRVPVPLPAGFARLCATHAYLGMLDVQPLANPSGGKSELRECTFWAERLGGGPGAGTWRPVAILGLAAEAADSGGGNLFTIVV